MRYLLCVSLMVTMWHFSSKFDQQLSLYCGSVKPKFKTGPEYWFLWESCELRFPKFTDNFGSFFKYTFKSSSNFYPIGITWKKWRIQFVCNQCQWKCDVCIHYDVSLYQHIPSAGNAPLKDNFLSSDLGSTAHLSLLNISCLLLHYTLDVQY